MERSLNRADGGRTSHSAPSRRVGLELKSPGLCQEGQQSVSGGHLVSARSSQINRSEVSKTSTLLKCRARHSSATLSSSFPSMQFVSSLVCRDSIHLLPVFVLFPLHVVSMFDHSLASLVSGLGFKGAGPAPGFLLLGGLGLGLLLGVRPCWILDSGERPF